MPKTNSTAVRFLAAILETSIEVLQDNGLDVERISETQAEALAGVLLDGRLIDPVVFKAISILVAERLRLSVTKH